MHSPRLIAVPCRISPGVVSDERAFEIALSDGNPHVGVAPAHYFWNDGKQPLAADEPAQDREIEGWIAARLLERQNGTTLVSIPDGSVAKVNSSVIVPRPAEVVIDVPVRP